jgi:hypothetical protein
MSTCSRQADAQQKVPYLEAIGTGSAWFSVGELGFGGTNKEACQL